MLFKETKSKDWFGILITIIEKSFNTLAGPHPIELRKLMASNKTKFLRETSVFLRSLILKAGSLPEYRSQRI
jgi:hypothetical protein